ncbi:hypothetical protein FRC00_003664 [Tulasnella sp. 408]|nr:hypothetical protein FRC00_003664 [Tulasnella sp. 408]
MAKKRTGGWKPTGPLKWELGAPHGATGVRIDRLWAVKYSIMRAHSKDKFEEVERIQVHKDLQDGVKKLYLYLEKLTAPSRGGSLHHRLSEREVARAAYIWKAFKKQLYELHRTSTRTLTNGNMMKRLKVLIEELEENREPGTAAEAEDTSERPTSGQDVDYAGSEKEAPSRKSGSEEDTDEEASDEEGTVISNLNSNQVLPDEALSPRMQVALNWMAEMALDFTGGDEGSGLDKDILPYEPSIKAQPISRSIFQVHKVRSMGSQLRAFADVKALSDSNPMDAYHFEGRAREDLPVVCTL